MGVGGGVTVSDKVVDRLGEAVNEGDALSDKLGVREVVTLPRLWEKESLVDWDSDAEPEREIVGRVRVRVSVGVAVVDTESVKDMLADSLSDVEFVNVNGGVTVGVGVSVGDCEVDDVSDTDVD